MNTLRRLSLATLMALLLLVVPTLFAQETFGLSDEDFTLLTTANATSFGGDPLAYEFTANLSMNAMGSDGSANLSGSGVVGGDETTPLFLLAVTGEFVDSGDTTPVNAELRLVGDTLYWSEDGTSWQGGAVEDIVSQFSSMTSMMGGGALPVNPDDLASGDLSGLAGMEGFSEAMTALASLDPSEFVSMSRDDADGLAHFTVDLSLSDLLSSPALAPLFAMGMSGGATGTEMTPEQIQQMTQGMAMMFSGATVTLEEYVDQETSLIQRAVLDINVPLSMMTGSADAAVLFNFDINLSGYGDPVSVEAPEGATMMPSSDGK